MLDVVILGGGVSGCIAAQLLASEGLETAIVEPLARPGGNHQSWDHDGMTFDVGSIFFRTGTPFLRMFPFLTDICVPVTPALQRIVDDGGLLKYPFDFHGDFGDRAALEKLMILGDITWNRLWQRRPGTAREFVHHRMGTRLGRTTGLLSYMERMFGETADSLSISLADKRMGQVSRASALRKIRKLIKQDHTRRPKLPQHMVRPRAGFGDMYRQIYQHLNHQGVGIDLDCAIEGIRRNGDGFTIQTANGHLQTHAVVNTMPLNILCILAELPVAKVLPHVSLKTICCSFRGDRNFDGNVLYNFLSTGMWKRMTVHSDFYGETPDGRTYMSVEFPYRCEVASDVDQLEDLKSSTRSAGLFDGDLQMLGSHVTPYAYPVPTIANERTSVEMLEAITAFGICSVGRQGRYDYIPSANKAVNAVTRILNASMI
ncbi:MAG: hypothetical protein CMH12_18405 [Maritimibacter sp.]|nr:hypothetical protein [Maritimibacter sp.]